MLIMKINNNLIYRKDNKSYLINNNNHNIFKI